MCGSLFFSKVFSCCLSPLSEVDPGNVKLFATIVHDYKIWIWLLDVTGLINEPLVVFIAISLLIV